VKTFSNNELKQFSEEITDTCFVKVQRNGNTGILYYKAGQVINARIDNEFGKKNADEILTWKDATFEKIKIDSVTKFQSDDIKFIFDMIEFNAMSADIYIKINGEIVVLSFSEGRLISVMPEKQVTKEFIQELISIKGQTLKMKQTAEKTGDIDVFISELLGE